MEVEKMLKRIISGILAFLMVVAILPSAVFADEPAMHTTATIQNEYIKVTVSTQNGGYVISTLEGDILKKSDDSVDLTHRGENFDTSFTSFRLGDEDLVFGTTGGALSTAATDDTIVSTWIRGDFEYIQTITLVNNSDSEQLGTAQITYTVKNNSESAEEIKSRVLMDTQLGDKDYGYYEVSRQQLGQGYEYFEFERSWDNASGSAMPADYFVRDNPFSASIVGYGVNSVFEDNKPYKMTFAHWANIAQTRFDYTPDATLNFTNPINDEKTGDSAVALYYDLGSVAAGGEKSFATYYGVTANLKNKDNKILINTVAPTILTLNNEKTAFIGTTGQPDGIVRINTAITNPLTSTKTYSNLNVVVYANGFTTQRQTDGDSWVNYDNTTPIYSEIINLAPGEKQETYFDFKFTPQEGAELGGFVTKVFNMDTAVNDLGYYAEDYSLGTTENFIVIPGTNPELPAITLSDLQPKILYNDDIRYLTVLGRGVNFFNASQLNKIELRGDNGIVYDVPLDSLTVEQTDDGSDPVSASVLLDEYMAPGRYQLHFLWKPNSEQEALQGVPDDFTSSAMYVFMTADEAFRNEKYGVIAVMRKDGNKYGITEYKDEMAFEAANVEDDDLLISLRGPIINETKNGKVSYRIAGNSSDVIINNILNYHGGSLTIEEVDGTVTILMDGKLTSIGANTIVRDGTAMFELESGTNYIIPTYDADGGIVDGGSLTRGQEFIELKWNSTVDVLQTIGGFLIDLRYGVLGKIQDAEDSSKTYNVISFGGGLDLSFMTPGGAATARENKTMHGGWTQSTTNNWQWDAASGKYKPTGRGDIAPPDAVEKPGGSVNIYDVLYGGKDPGYLGINMSAAITLPQIVAFLPNKIEGQLNLNTIGTYSVGVEAEVDTTVFEMHLAFVIKEAPGGAPVPDKLYFTIGGFEPGVNIDGMGVLWVTNGSGGFDNLYNTIYGLDGEPPLKLFMHADFDVAKILTGAADLELSLRAMSLKFSDLSLKMAEDTEFLKDGSMDLTWYPNFSLTADAAVSFLDVFNGDFQISAYSNADVAFFLEFLMNVSLGLPKDIPFVGGMTIASMNLGGGTEKVWGAITLLEMIRVGFTYYWTGDFKFSSGDVSGNQQLDAANAANAGLMRTQQAFAAITAPQQMQTDPQTGQTQYVSVGSNLRFVTGSVVVDDVEKLIQNANNPRLRAAVVTQPQVSTNESRDTHLVQFTNAGDYIVSIIRADGEAITAADLMSYLTVTKGGQPYELKIYGSSNGNGGTYNEKEANVNIAGDIAYVIIPHTDATANSNFVLRFGDGEAYDVGAIYVEPLSSLIAYNASVSGQDLTVTWSGANVTDTAVINVTLSEEKGGAGVVVASGIDAKTRTSEVITLPETLAAGDYYVTLSLSDEGKSFDTYRVSAPVAVTNAKAPAAPTSVGLANAGNDKLKITVSPAENETNLDGYFIDVYEDGKLIDAGLYYAKEDADSILIGGRYDVPDVDEEGNPITVEGHSPSIDADGNTIGTYSTLGYNPGSEYSVRVRAGNIEETDDVEVYYCSSFATSEAVTLREADPPTVSFAYSNGSIKLSSDVNVTGEIYINNGEPINVANTKSFSQAADLPDGDHTLEFIGADAEGDRAIVKQIISVDTTSPVIMLESPLRGIFTDDIISIEGIIADADTDLTLTISLNGSPLTLPSSAFADGMLNYDLPLGTAANLTNITIEITAADKSGNTSSKIVQLTSSQMVNVGEIAIYANGVAIGDEGISLSVGGSPARITVMGKLPDETWIDITENESVVLDIVGGNSVSLSGREVTAKTDGQSLLSVSLDLGGERRLLCGTVITVGVAANNIYTVTLDPGRGSITQTSLQTDSEGKLSDLPTPTISGNYRFDGWFTAPSGGTKITLNSVFTQDMTIYAQWTYMGDSDGSDGSDDDSIYTITLDPGSGSITQTSLQTDPDGKLSVLPTPTISGSYRFDGWFTAPSGGTRITLNTVFTQDMTIYAQWTYTGGSVYNPPPTKPGDDQSNEDDENSDGSDSDGYNPESFRYARFLQDAWQIIIQMIREGVTSFKIDNIGVLTEENIADVVEAADGTPIKMAFRTLHPASTGKRKIVDTQLLFYDVGGLIVLEEDVSVFTSQRSKIARSVKTKFDKYFDNIVTVVEVAHEGEFEQTGRVAVKIDPESELDSEKLYVYVYDAETNKYKKSGTAKVDKNGYAQFNIKAGGLYILSDGLLVK
jgi:hypothetical protein